MARHATYGNDGPPAQIAYYAGLQEADKGALAPSPFCDNYY